MSEAQLRKNLTSLPSLSDICIPLVKRALLASTMFLSDSDSSREQVWLNKAVTSSRDFCVREKSIDGEIYH